MAYRTQPLSLRAVIAGIVVESKPTEYRGVTMRSKLEADFARFLDSRRVDWVYEPAIFGPIGQGYLPDFQVLRPDEHHYFEVKPTLREVDEAKRRMAVIWDSYPDATLVIACAEQSRFFSATARGEWTTWVELWKHS